MAASASLAVGNVAVACPPTISTCLNEGIVFSGDHASSYGRTADMWGRTCGVPVTALAAVKTFSSRWDSPSRTKLAFLDKLGRKGGTFCSFRVKRGRSMVRSRHVASGVIGDARVNAGLTREIRGVTTVLSSKWAGWDVNGRRRNSPLVRG